MNTKRKSSPLLYPAMILSLASLAWTSWSLVGLLGAGPIGLTVAAGADVIWGAVIVAEYRGTRIAGKAWAVPAIGWAALLAVAVLLAWHGLDLHMMALAAAGPLLPLGAKVVWALALNDMRDPAALTDTERLALAEMERGMAFEEARHGITMRRRRMEGELLMTDVSVDFDLELMRQDKERDLNRRRPLELTATSSVRSAVDANGEANDDANRNANRNANGEANSETNAFAKDEGEQFAQIVAETDVADDANDAGRDTDRVAPFGFSAVFAEANQTRPQKANAPRPQRANAKPSAAANRSPRKAKPKDPREAAAADYQASVEDGEPLSGAELGRRYGHTARWGQLLIAELKK